MRIKKHNWAFHAMLSPGMILLFIFNVIPMIGIIIAFQRYSPFAPRWGLASPWVGLQNFRTLLFVHPDAMQVVRNTIIIASWRIVLMLTVPVAFAILLNECLNIGAKRVIQTIVYLPHFLSWVIVGAMFMQFFSPTGIVNTMLLSLGILQEPISFMRSNTWFRPIVIGTDVWKNFGFASIVYIAAITNIDPNLFEAAEIDGANRWQRISRITIPCVKPTIVLMGTLALGGILSVSGDQILNMYSIPVYRTGDVVSTFVYRIGILNMRFHLATAMELMTSVIGMVLIIISWFLARKFAGYSIF